ncbi:hypothetical protein PTKIN_Ptkin08bG0089100 [Pterospermum kingtungense]
MEIEVADKLRKLENTINMLLEVILANLGTKINNNLEISSLKGKSRIMGNECHNSSEEARPILASKLAKLKFPKFVDEDLAIWYTRVE